MVSLYIFASTTSPQNRSYNFTDDLSRSRCEHQQQGAVAGYVAMQKCECL